MDEPENLVLPELREEALGSMQSVATAVAATQRVRVRLEGFADQLGSLRQEMSGIGQEAGPHRQEVGCLRHEVGSFRQATNAFREGSRRAALRLESDLVHRETQNISRHGETLLALRELCELRARADALEQASG